VSYHVTTRLGDKTIAFQVPADDPFIRQTVTVGWPDLLRGLLRRQLTVTVIVGADAATIDAVQALEEPAT